MNHKELQMEKHSVKSLVHAKCSINISYIVTIIRSQV